MTEQQTRPRNAIRELGEWIASCEMHPDEYHRVRNLLDAALREQTRITPLDEEQVAQVLASMYHTPIGEVTDEVRASARMFVNRYRALPRTPGEDQTDE